MAIKLIIGLANPGKEYATTRHNAGAWWIETFCENNNIKLKVDSKLNASLGEATVNNSKIKIAIPTTYMNHSGQAVGKIMRYYQLKPEELLIAHDELDFDPGTIKLKTGGGHGGHNGLRDIIPSVGSKDFHRLRIGIGHPGDKSMVADYVLNTPSKHDMQQILNAIADSMYVLNDIISGDIATAMNNLH